MLPVFTRGFWLWKGLGYTGVDDLISFPATQLSSVTFLNSLFAKNAISAQHSDLLLVRRSMAILIYEEGASVRAPQLDMLLLGSKANMQKVF